MPYIYHQKSFACATRWKSNFGCETLHIMRIFVLRDNNTTRLWKANITSHIFRECVQYTHNTIYILYACIHIGMWTSARSFKTFQTRAIYVLHIYLLYTKIVYYAFPITFTPIYYTTHNVHYICINKRKIHHTHMWSRRRSF